MNVQSRDVKGQIESLLKKEFSDAHVVVEGQEGTCALTIKIASDVFCGKRRVVQHQMIYAVLQDFLDSGVLHAVSIDVRPKEQM